MNNIKNFKIFYILLFFSLVYLSNIIFSNELDTFKLQVGWYQESLYRLNYFDFGFIKRGLVGSIIYPFKSHYKLSIFLISLLVCVLIIYYFVEITFNEKLKEIKNYLILFSISPFFFQFLGYDFGRLDQWGILFLLMSALFRSLKDSALVVLAMPLATVGGRPELAILVGEEVPEVRGRA